ncbi:g11706 [Coccomyxa viridis]|uniref:G11706 protein n=1 Tax=Coccomyxa viridis TaxID=1274662 RepID=A0ABP1GCQ3_9CHLO
MADMVPVVAEEMAMGSMVVRNRGGGGAGYVGGQGGQDVNLGTGATRRAVGGTSFLAASPTVRGGCTVLGGNSGNGYVIIVLQ